MVVFLEVSLLRQNRASPAVNYVLARENKANRAGGAPRLEKYARAFPRRYVFRYENRSELKKQYSARLKRLLLFCLQRPTFFKGSVTASTLEKYSHSCSCSVKTRLARVWR